MQTMSKSSFQQGSHCTHDVLGDLQKVGRIRYATPPLDDSTIVERRQNGRLDIILVEMILEYDITFSVTFSAIPDYFATSGIHPIVFEMIFRPVEIFDNLSQLLELF